MTAAHHRPAVERQHLWWRQPADADGAQQHSGTPMSTIPCVLCRPGLWPHAGLSEELPSPFPPITWKS